MSLRPIQVLTNAHPHRPALDTAISWVLLQAVAQGAQPETLRLYRPGDIVAFGPLDIRSPGYRDAVRAARAGGFQAIQRLVGGRAAVFHLLTIAFAWTIPDPDAYVHTRERFQELADIMATALRRLGVDARVGEVPGEYCPGQYSVNARGATKLMGVGQRVTAGAAHVGGVVVVGDSALVREILVPVYDALALPWDPTTVGSVEDEVGDIPYGDVRRAILEEFASRYALTKGRLPAHVVRRARAMAPRFLAPYSDGGQPS